MISFQVSSNPERYFPSQTAKFQEALDGLYAAGRIPQLIDPPVSSGCGVWPGVNWPKLSPLEIGVFRYPIFGVSRYAYGAFLIDGSTLERLYTDGLAGAYATGTLRLYDVTTNTETGEETSTARVFQYIRIHGVTPVAKQSSDDRPAAASDADELLEDDLFIVVLVDSRYAYAQNLITSEIVTTSWDTVFTSSNFVGGTVADSIPAAYLSPNVAKWTTYNLVGMPRAVVADIVASSLGMRTIVSTAASLSHQRPTTDRRAAALAIYTDALTDGRVIAGGILQDKDASLETPRNYYGVFQPPEKFVTSLGETTVSTEVEYVTYDTGGNTRAVAVWSDGFTDVSSSDRTALVEQWRDDHIAWINAPAEFVCAGVMPVPANPFFSEVVYRHDGRTATTQFTRAAAETGSYRKPGESASAYRVLTAWKEPVDYVYSTDQDIPAISIPGRGPLRLLFRGQTDTTQNGIYVVGSDGSLSRPVDADTGLKLIGAAVRPKVPVSVAPAGTDAIPYSVVYQCALVSNLTPGGFDYNSWSNAGGDVYGPDAITRPGGGGTNVPTYYLPMFDELDGKTILQSGVWLDSYGDTTGAATIGGFAFWAFGPDLTEGYVGKYSVPNGSGTVGLGVWSGAVIGTPDGGLQAAEIYANVIQTVGVSAFISSPLFRSGTSDGLTGALAPGAAAIGGIITSLGSGTFGTVTEVTGGTSDGVTVGVTSGTTTPALAVTLTDITPDSVDTPTITQTAASSTNTPLTITGAAAQTAPLIDLRLDGGGQLLGVAPGSCAFSTDETEFTFNKLVQVGTGNGYVQLWNDGAGNGQLRLWDSANAAYTAVTAGDHLIALDSGVDFLAYGQVGTAGATLYGDGSNLTGITATVVGAIPSSYLDTDGTLAADSDTKVATQKAVRTFVTTAVSGLLDFKGATDCSSNPNYPAASKGDAYIVSVAGKIGGASGTSVDAGDWYIATADNAGGTQASVGTSWAVLEHNVVGPLLAVNNLSDVANGATARANLGLTIGTNVQAYDADLSALASLTGTNTIYYRSAANTWTAVTIGSGLSFSAGSLTATGSGGTVTSVALSLPGMFSVSGSPVTGSGTLTATLAAQGPNAVFVGPPSGASASPTFRLLVAADLPLLNGLTASDAALDDLIPEYDTSATANRAVTPERLLALLRVNPGGRLTITTGTPVVTTPGTSSTVYYTPYLHDIIVLWDGTRWLAKQFTEMSLSLSGLTTSLNYDVFCYLSSGTPTLEKLAWTDGTTRATAITIQDGRYCKSGDKTRLYLGTFAAASATTTALTNGAVLVWNMYNRVRRYMFVQETADSWTYSTATWRSMNNSTGNRLQFVCGLPEDVVSVQTNVTVNPGVGGGAAVGIGLDRTNANDAQTTGYQTDPGVSTIGARWAGNVTGYHFAQAIEYGQVGTPTFYGDAGVPAFIQSAITGEVWS